VSRRRLSPDVPAEIVAHYEHGYDEDARIRDGFRQLELLRTQEIVRRYLPAGPLRIADIGGATGVHARWLAEDGHDVVVVDIAPRHVAAANALAADGLSVTAELGDARALNFADDSFDAVLLLGPLYHLTERADRVQALREARRVARGSGPVFVAAVSRFAALFDGLASGYIFDPSFRSVVERDLTDGQHRNPDQVAGWFTTAYFHHPDDLVAEVRAAGLTTVACLGVEGLAGWLPHLEAHWDDPVDREVILAACRAVEAEPSLRGLSAHLLLVAVNQEHD
jgi:SAM-dependent methyltransferase